VVEAPYLRIVSDIREAIARGELRHGDLLPSRAELMAEYRVSAPTASKAIRAAIQAGLATSQPGVGVFARVWQPIRRVVPDRFADPAVRATSSDVRGRALVVSAEVELAVPPEPVAAELGSDGQALVRRRVFAVDGLPVQIAQSWVPVDVAPPQLYERDTGPGGMWARLEEVGHGPVGPCEESWRVRPAEDHERATLNLPQGSRVLDGIRVARDASRRVVDVTTMVLAEHAYVLVLRFDL
jgi:GntR family transcriptional regulator